MSVQPYSIGDTLLAIAAANAEADGRWVDVVLVADSRVQHEDENMRAAHAAPMESLGKLLPLFELVHDLGSVSIHSRGSPERGQYQTYRAIQTIAKCRAPYALLNFSPELCKWADDFLAKCGPRVVTVNLRTASHHRHRNHDPCTWWAALDSRALESLGLTFLVVGEAHEASERMRGVPGAAFAKDHGTTLLQDLALVHRSKAHIGSPSGPCAVAMLGTAPYFFPASDMGPHLDRYGGALERRGSDFAYSWASPGQRFSAEPESVPLLVGAVRELAKRAF
jgi:hypothetical protein